jgi:hypothetical protein
MDQNDREQLAKIICYGLGIAIAYHLLVWLFHYIIAFLAILGVGYLYLQYLKNNRRRW